MKRRTFLRLTGQGIVGASVLGLLPGGWLTQAVLARASAKKPGNPASKRDRKTDSAKSSVGSRPTVAVLYFDYAGKNEELAVLRKGLAQMLISDLAGHERIRLVERARLEAVLAELKLGRSRKIDKKTAARIGKLLGAQYLVLGNYFSLLGSLRVDARVVSVETGQILFSTGSNGKVDEFLNIEGAVATALGAHLTKGLPAIPATPSRGGGNTHHKHPGHKHRGRPSRRRPRRPKRLRTRTALKYAQALDARDHGDMVTAKRRLQAVVKEQPDFGLAKRDLAMFVQ